MSELTVLLAAVRDGDRAAKDRLYQVAYHELHRLAHARLKRQSRMTLLDTTGLVHESYLRLAGGTALDLKDRAHFLTYAAKVMRSIVVDYARRRAADKRGGNAAVVTMSTNIADAMVTDDEQILRINEALEQLATIDERLVRIVEMRYFIGLTEKEIAESLGVTDRTVRREWDKARLFLTATLKS
jgi:RNA polymerase sigma factor (TIGR02999 family)